MRRVPSTGTVNALFRLGSDLVVRLCRVPWAAGDEAKEQRWLRQLAPYLPVDIPEPVVVGQPTDEYPWTWSILRWLPGTNPVPGNLTTPDRLAADLAEFVTAFRAIGNILTVDGRLSAVIDFATVGIGDPACDLIVAWTILPANVRHEFRSMVGCDDATWTRARALSMSLGGLHYYRAIEPTLATEAQYTIHEVLADPSTS